MKLITLFAVFFKIGLFSFGGGYAMLPMIYQDIGKFGFMQAREFSDIVALSQMTPGPIAVNAATYVGFKYAGFWGATSATIGVCMPSFILVLIIAAFFYKFKESKIVQALLSGIRPATVGMIASAVLFFAQSSLYNPELMGEILKKPLQAVSLPALGICALTVFLNSKFKWDPILLTVLAGVLGAFIL